MEVDQPAGVSVDQNRCDDSHPTRHDDRFNISRAECRHQRMIQGFTSVVFSVINELAGNPEAFSPLPGSTAWVVHNQQLQRGLEAALCGGLVQSFEIAARARGHDADAQRRRELRPCSDGRNNQFERISFKDLASV